MPRIQFRPASPMAVSDREFASLLPVAINSPASGGIKTLAAGGGFPRLSPFAEPAALGVRETPSSHAKSALAAAGCDRKATPIPSRPVTFGADAAFSSNAEGATAPPPRQQMISGALTLPCGRVVEFAVRVTEGAV